jgi:hypothetical protein
MGIGNLESVLRDYARRFGADTRNWAFVTGDFASIQKVAVDGYMMPLAYEAGGAGSRASTAARARYWRVARGDHAPLPR